MVILSEDGLKQEDPAGKEPAGQTSGSGWGLNRDCNDTQSSHYLLIHGGGR